MRVGVVGTGALGAHHARILAGSRSAELVGVFDLRKEAAARVAERHGTRAFPDLESLIREVEAAVVAVPTAAHAAVGARLLEQGVHVLVEKPIAASLAESDTLLAAAGDRVLAVGHVEFYNPAIQALLGLGLPPGFVEVHRLAAFKPRSLDIDVILDLMIHDLQVLHALDPSPIAEIRATGINVLTERIDIANVRIALESGCIANLTASRVSDETVRKLRAFLPRSYYSVDYGLKEVRGYRLEEGGDRRILPHDLEVAPDDALESELEEFLRACRGEPALVVDGGQGRRALSTALAIVHAIGAERG